MKVGSLFSGAGGLDLAVETFFDATPAWFVEFDEAPSKVLAYRFPDVPNYGDITTVDWAQVEPVDILTGGFPCQDVSLAGRRAGMKDGTRSGLWAHYAKAISILKPKLVVIENVRGLLSAEAHSDVEPCPWCLGDGTDQHALRALGAVLGDLADLGYDAGWCGVRAADAGAPHGRFRIFIVAHSPSGGSGFFYDRASRQETRGGRIWEPDGDSRILPVAHADDLGQERCRPARARRDGSENISDASADAGSSAFGEQSGGSSAEEAGTRSGDRSGDHGRERSDQVGREAIPHSEGERRNDGHPINVRTTSGEVNLLVHAGNAPGGTAGTPTIEWGPYEPAIRRWETVTGRSAPAPTVADGRNGQHRLSARFTEWMMGWPDGWVTDPAIGLTRNQQLKICGNGVVPQQAYLALQTLSGESLGQEAVMA